MKQGKFGPTVRFFLSELRTILGHKNWQILPGIGTLSSGAFLGAQFINYSLWVTNAERDESFEEDTVTSRVLEIRSDQLR